MERKFFVILIVGLVVISAILYGCVNQKKNLELSGVIKETIGKPSMFGQYYLQKEDGGGVVLDSIIRINLFDYLEQNVTIQGFYENRTLDCDPRLQCATNQEYSVFFVTSIINHSNNAGVCLKEGESGDGDCCEGLKREPDCFLDKNVSQCVCINCWVCLKCIKTNCSNGICGDQEDRCNCWEDCS